MKIITVEFQYPDIRTRHWPVNETPFVLDIRPNGPDNKYTWNTGEHLIYTKKAGPISEF